MTTAVTIILAVIIGLLYQHIINKLDTVIGYLHDIDQVVNPGHGLNE